MQTMKKLFLILSVAAGLVSCEDFLTAGDPNKIDAPSYFRNESDLEAYANGFLQTMIPTAISVATGDAHADYMAWRGEWPARRFSTITRASHASGGPIST